MAQIQFSLMKKIKIGRPEHLLTHHLPTSDNISFFLPTPTPTPSKWTSYDYHPLCLRDQSFATRFYFEASFLKKENLF